MYCSCLLLLSIDSLVPAAYRSLQCQLPFIVSSSVTLSPHIMPMPNFAGVFENRTVQYGLSLVLAYYSLKYFFVPLISEVMNAPDPKETEAKSSARSALVRHFSSQRRQVPDTNPYEERLIADLVFPEQLDTTLDDIAGWSSSSRRCTRRSYCRSALRTSSQPCNAPTYLPPPRPPPPRRCCLLRAVCCYTGHLVAEK